MYTVWLYSTGLSPTRSAPVSTLHGLVAKAPSAWLPQLPVQAAHKCRPIRIFQQLELIQKTGPSGCIWHQKKQSIQQASSSARSSGWSRPNCSASLITALRPRVWQQRQPGNIEYTMLISGLYCCFSLNLFSICSIVLHAVLRAVRGTSRRFMAS